MIYFKRVPLNSGEKELLEKAIRKVALRRVKSLDFQSTVYDTGADKLFLGLDDTKDVKFTRLRTSLERFFPQIIISFPKDETSSEYRLRLGFFPALIFAMALIAFLINTGFAIIDSESLDEILILMAPLAIFIVLAFLELKIVNSKINKAVARYEKEADISA